MQALRSSGFLATLLSNIFEHHYFHKFNNMKYSKLKMHPSFKFGRKRVSEEDAFDFFKLFHNCILIVDQINRFCDYYIRFEKLFPKELGHISNFIHSLFKSSGKIFSQPNIICSSANNIQFINPSLDLSKFYFWGSVNKNKDDFSCYLIFYSSKILKFDLNSLSEEIRNHLINRIIDFSFFL